MTTPDVPIRLEFSVEVDGTPEQVWAAIATAPGLESWFVPTDVEEGAGGSMVAHMGEMDMPATITDWDPPRRLVYEERGWAEAMGYGDADVTPLVSEFLVESRAGGTCVVHVVTSAFGTGADWEQGALDGMAEGWIPFFEHLRIYLARFGGQPVRTFELSAKPPGAVMAIRAVMADQLGAGEVGQVVSLDGRPLVVEQLEPSLLVRTDDPVGGFVRLTAWGADDDASANVHGYLFDADDAAVESARKVWGAWLDDVVAEVTP